MPTTDSRHEGLNLEPTPLAGATTELAAQAAQLAAVAAAEEQALTMASALNDFERDKKQAVILAELARIVADLAKASA